MQSIRAFIEGAAMTDPEQVIKQALDGTFTRFCPEVGRVETIRVPYDFTPALLYKGPRGPKHVISGSKGGKVTAERHRCTWTPVDDERLVGMFRRGHGSTFMAKALCRSRTAIDYRLRCLREAGKLTVKR
jgi:hypothetical protein